MSETKQDVEGVLVTVIESGSTNTVGYTVAINYDGSATAQIEGRFDLPPRSQQFPPGTIDTKTLQSLLTAVGDVSKIPTTGFRSKPASFATTTKISYEGNTSGDLQCFPQNGVGGDPAQLQADGNLVKFVETTLQQLKISVLPQPVSEGDVAVLSVSNSDYTFHVEIQNDGSAKGAVCFKTHPLAEERNYPAGTFDTTCLLSLLGRIGDVSEIPIETMEITYGGKASGNLLSIEQNGSGYDRARLEAAHHLTKLLHSTVSQLKIADTRASSELPDAA